MIWKCLDCRSNNVKMQSRYPRCEDCLSFDVIEVME